MGKKSTRVCAFCGGTPVSREHVWPQWLRNTPQGKAHHESRQYTREPHQIVVYRAAISGESEAISFDTYPRGVVVPVMDTTVKVPCKTCNNGWMAQLEDAAKPLLVSMMNSAESGGGYRLSPADVDLLRRWAVKTAAMFEFNHPPTRTFDQSVLSAIRDDSINFPGHWHIGLMRSTVKDLRFHLSHGGGPHGVIYAGTNELVHLGKISQTLLGLGDQVIVLRYANSEKLKGVILWAIDELPDPPVWLYAGTAAHGPGPQLDEAGWELLRRAQPRSINSL